MNDELRVKPRVLAAGSEPTLAPILVPSSVPWSSYLFYEGTYWLSAAAMVMGYSLRTEGLHHVPRQGPVLFIANHQSYLDPTLVGLAVRRHIAYLARKTLFRNRFFAWLIRMLNAVPIDQERTGIEGLRITLRLLQVGWAVVVFPEGERTADGDLQPLQPGIQVLIKRAQAPIVPVGIAGAHDAWPRWRRSPVLAPLFLPPTQATLAVAVGKPLDPRRFLHLPRAQLLTELFEEIRLVHQRAERLRRKPALL